MLSRDRAPASSGEGVGGRSAPAGLLRFALSAGGYVFLAGLVVVGIGLGKFSLPGGDVTDIYDRAGDLLRSGANPYFGDRLAASFFYAPPWAVLFAALSILPPLDQHLLILGVEVAALRTMARSWLRVGYLCWIPLLPFELFSGNINLFIAAAIVAGTRGRGWPVALASLAKLSPILAADRSTIRQVLLTLALAVLVTAPQLWLWPAWVQHGLQAVGSGIGPQIPIPLVVRWAAAAGLLTMRRPWTRALAAVVAVPGFYYGTLVMLIAPLIVWLDSRRSVPVGVEAHVQTPRSG